MARIFSQPNELKASFVSHIQAKQTAHIEEVRTRVHTHVPGFLRWALTPLADRMVRSKQHRDDLQGERGEFAMKVRLWTRLPNSWSVINDVVVEYQSGEFAQIDHVVIGPPGVFLIETKAWTGAILLKHDQCFRKEANRWVKVASPIRQNRTHVQRFLHWYGVHKLPAPPPPVHPLVVFTHATWLKSADCSMPIVTPKQALVTMQTTRGEQLGIETINGIVQALLSPTPVDEPVDNIADHPSSSDVQIHEGVTRQGRKYVRIEGTHDAAEAIWGRYGRPGTMMPDRFHPHAFFFYVDDSH